MRIQQTARALLIVLALIAVRATVLKSQSQNQKAAVVTGNAKVDKLLSQMTLDEKISMVHGATEDPATTQGEAGYLPGVPRLGIPSLRFVDGPPGVLSNERSTAMTATMGLAATFSRTDAQQNGVVIGRDARALGIDVVLQPFVNIARDFTFTRAYNTYGEDPLLTGQIAAAFVTGVQSQGAMAQAKHYVGYDGGNDVTADAQTLREIYVAPFEDVSKAGVSSVMCAYSHINGPYSCGNNETLNNILKNEIGFKGFVTSDWGATHGTDFITFGQDLEMPGSTGGNNLSYFSPNPSGPPRAQGGGNAAPAGGTGGVMPEEGPPVAGGFPSHFDGALPMGMKSAVTSGKIPEAALDHAVGRILYQMDKFGFLGTAPNHNVAALQTVPDAGVVQKTGEDAAVLLKNEGDVLPLQESEIETVAFIGPGAGQTVAVGLPGEKALGFPERQAGPVQAIEKSTNKKIVFAVADDLTGTPIPASMLTHDGNPGLARTDAKGGDAHIDPELNFTIGKGDALPAGSSYNWTGTLTLPSAGDYMFCLQGLGASAVVTLDGKAVARITGGNRGLQPGQDSMLPTTDSLDNLRTKLSLTAGAHAITVSTTGGKRNEPVQVRLNWVTPGQQQANYAAAVEAGKHARKAVIFAWARGRPNFTIPGDQNKLIEEIASANPNTIVVLNTSLPVPMPWLDHVKAVVQMWYPGGEGGPATAKILLGRANPAGRLPITWPQQLEQMVANDPAHPERSSLGVNGKTSYSEGIFVGYRWFDKQDVKPLFPFGYGLSYTAFAYSGLKIARSTDGGLDVTFSVRNMGKMNGDEVPQVYLGVPSNQPAGTQFAVKALAAFDRISVPTGQTKSVVLHVAPRQLQYWSNSENKWVTAKGSRAVYVGASSRDIRLHANANIN